MRKFIGVLLSVLCICCAAIGLTGCKKDKHIHAFDKQVITDEYKATDATCTEAATYYYSCFCGEKGTETFTSGNALGHSFTNYVSDNNATCTEDGTKTAKCDRCSVTDTVADEGSKLPHTFDKQVATEKYLASTATCTEAAKYYYSCSCGEKGTETFTSGNALGHSFTNYVSDNNATCTQDGTKTAKCDRCDETDTVKDIDSKLHHSYTEQIVSDEYLAAPATCTEKAKYYYSCKCGATGIETFEYGSTTNHNFVNGSCTYCGKEQESSKGLEFTLLDDGAYEVSGLGSCTDTEIVIPSVYNDKPVTVIGFKAFDGCSGLTSVTIPDSVTFIGSGAFRDCSRLTSVTIPNGVTSISYSAFGGCDNLKYNEYSNALYLGNKNNSYVALIKAKSTDITSCIINEKCKVIGDDAFRGCSGLTSVTIPDDVTSIGSSAFEGCRGLTSITIPDSVTFIGSYAFSGCSGLTSVTIPNSVTFIDWGAFV